MTLQSQTKPFAHARQAAHKIKSIAELGEIAAAARSAGDVVVLAHGTFDLLHMGHVRHLEVARREGTVLIVTLTADKYVNKGPGRPVFTERLRAEMIAALECVDWVGINDEFSAETILSTIKPSVYAKGSDYVNAASDVTGKIVNEREAVEAHGGRILFTDDITFSSSALINRYMSIYEPPLQKFLEKQRISGGLERLVNLLESVKDYRVLFIGDAIIDEYTYVLPMGKSAKENMIATLHQDSEMFAGGVFAAANHVATFCREVEVVTLLGGNDDHEQMIRESLRENVTLTPVYRPEAPTTRKNRFVDNSYSMRKLFEVYYMDDSPLSGEALENLCKILEGRLQNFDVVIITDFGHGLLGSEVIDLILEKSKFVAINAQSNSANYGYNLITKYPKADYICIDGPEARLAVHDKYADLADLAQRALPNAIDCPNIIVTQGKHGCFAYKRDSEIFQVPALTNSIVDTVGAGDAFFSVTAPLVAAGASMEDVAFIGNAAGAIKVGIIGHRTSVEKVPLIKFITALLK
jgi:rfaE bifunctional protein kinase chain/domain/rfaE bifunctional protein nucleotidyltransferase chain/domain